MKNQALAMIARGKMPKIRKSPIRSSVAPAQRMKTSSERGTPSAGVKLSGYSRRNARASSGFASFSVKATTARLSPTPIRSDGKSELHEPWRRREAREKERVHRVGTPAREEKETRESEIVHVLHHGLESHDRDPEKPDESEPDTRRPREAPVQETQAEADLRESYPVKARSRKGIVGREERPAHSENDERQTQVDSEDQRHERVETDAAEVVSAEGFRTGNHVASASSVPEVPGGSR